MSGQPKELRAVSLPRSERPKIVANLRWQGEIAWDKHCVDCFVSGSSCSVLWRLILVRAGVEAFASDLFLCANCFRRLQGVPPRDAAVPPPTAAAGPP